MARFEQSNPGPTIKVENGHCGSVLELVRTMADKSAIIVIVNHNGNIGLRRVRPVKDIPDTFQSFEKADERPCPTVVQDSKVAARSVEMEDMPAPYQARTVAERSAEEERIQVARLARRVMADRGHWEMRVPEASTAKHDQRRHARCEYRGITRSASRRRSE